MTPSPQIDSPIGRKVREWIGKTPNDKVPDYVGLRIFRRQKGLCGLSGQKIKVGDVKELHHIKGLAEGGAHKESNLVWVLSSAHKVETAEQAGRRAKADAVAKKHFGVAQPNDRPGPRSLKASPKDRTYKDPFAGLPRRCCGVVIKD